jgi:Tfp pilus assembly protein PilN
VLIGQAQDQDSVSKFNNNLKASTFIEKTDLARTTERKVGGKTAVDFEIRAGF